VGNHHDSHRTAYFGVLGNVIYRVLDLLLTLGVQGTSRLVQDKQLGLLNECSRNRNALFLTSREVQHARGADIGIQLVLHVVDKGGIRLLEGVDYLGFGRIFVSEEEVVLDGA
jgi:hypothetical protein